jgi:hypothetical protein
MQSITPRYTQASAHPRNIIFNKTPRFLFFFSFFLSFPRMRQRQSAKRSLPIGTIAKFAMRCFGKNLQLFERSESCKISKAPYCKFYCNCPIGVGALRRLTLPRSRE